MNNVTSLPEKKPEIPVAARDAIQYQQRRVWFLRSLLECVSIASQHGCDTECSDLEAALKGLTDYADSIHLALDTEALMRPSSQRHHTSEDALDEGPEDAQ